MTKRHDGSLEGSALWERIAELERQLRSAADDLARSVEASCHCPKCGEGFETIEGLSLRQRAEAAEAERDVLAKQVSLYDSAAQHPGTDQRHAGTSVATQLVHAQAMREKAEAERDALYERIEAWKDASGLTCGGDPDGVTPDAMQGYWEGVEAERDALAERVEQAEALYARELAAHGETIREKNLRILELEALERSMKHALVTELRARRVVLEETTGMVLSRAECEALASQLKPGWRDE